MRSLILAVLAGAIALAPMSSARAHGRPPFLGQIRFHPTDPDVIVVRATFGLVFTQDGGATWNWICAAVTETDPQREDPATWVAPDGAVLVGSFAGLSRSTVDRCEFDFVEGLRDVFVIDLHAARGAPDSIWAVVTSGRDPDEVYRSDDGGRSFGRVGEPIEEILLERVRVAPSDPTRVYLSGAAPLRTGHLDGGVDFDGGVVADGGAVNLPRRGFLLRSSDGGLTYEPIEMPLVDEERNVHLLAVDPTDPDRVLVRITRRVIDERAERVLLTEDAGDTWSEVLSVHQVSGGDFTEDGAGAYVTSRLRDGLWRSDDAGRTFVQAQPGLSLPCLGLRGDEVWTCVDELLDGYALGRSTDAGATLSERLRFEEIHTLPECPTCSEVAYVCAQWFPDLAYDLQLDGGGIDLPDGGSGAPRDAAAPVICRDGAVLDGSMDGAVDAGSGGGSGDCGCRAGPASSPSPWVLASVVGGLLLRKRRRTRRC